MFLKRSSETRGLTQVISILVPSVLPEDMERISPKFRFINVQFPHLDVLRMNDLLIFRTSKVGKRNIENEVNTMSKHINELEAK